MQQANMEADILRLNMKRNTTNVRQPHLLFLYQKQKVLQVDYWKNGLNQNETRRF